MTKSYQAARDNWDASVEASNEQRRRMVEDLKFSNPTDPEQWDPKIALVRMNDPGGSRPTFCFDQTNQYIAQVVNDSRMNKPQIQTVPANSGADEKVSEALDGIIRQIEYASGASMAYDTAQEHAARVGLGWFRIVPQVVDEEYNEQEIRIMRVHDPLMVHWDPNFTSPDGADQTFGFVETMIPKETYLRKYRKKKVSNWKEDGSWYDDDRARICEYFEQVETKTNMLVIAGPDGGRYATSEADYWETAQKTGFKAPYIAQFQSKTKSVRWSKLDGDDFLEETTDFPSQWIPLIPVMGYEIWIEGKRYLCGMVRRMMPGQKAYNIERNAEIELMSSQPKAPYLVPWEAVAKHQTEWGNANASNQAYLPYDHRDSQDQPIPAPSRLAPPNPGAAFNNLGLKGMADIQASIGMFKANLGAPSNETSGIAIKRREQQGDTANFHYVDNLARSMTHAGRIMVDMIPKVYDQAREIRILGLDGQTQPVKVDPQGQPAVMEGRKLVAINPGAGKYDVRCKVGPAYASLREEAADSLTKIVQTSPQLMSVLGPMWARMQDWPEAEKISKLLLALAPQQVQDLESQDEEIPPKALAKINQLQQQLQETQQRLQVVSDALVTAADEHSKTEAEVQNIKVDNQRENFRAMTERLKVLIAGMTPEEIVALTAQTAQEVMSTPV